MRICREKSTGKLIEMQSDATSGTLISNALRLGYNKDDIEEVIVSLEDWEIIKATVDIPPQNKSLIKALIGVLLSIVDGTTPDKGDINILRGGVI